MTVKDSCEQGYNKNRECSEMASLVDTRNSNDTLINPLPLLKSQKLKNWLLSVLTAGFLLGVVEEVLGNAIWEWIKKYFPL